VGHLADDALLRGNSDNEVHKSLPISSGNTKDAPGKQAGKQSGTNRISTGHRNVSVGHPYTNMFFRLFCEQLVSRYLVAIALN
jgi:hypothetical protein